MAYDSVDLPDPLGPITAMRLPDFTVGIHAP